MGSVKGKAEAKSCGVRDGGASAVRRGRRANGTPDRRARARRRTVDVAMSARTAAGFAGSERSSLRVIGRQPHAPCGGPSPRRSRSAGTAAAWQVRYTTACGMMGGHGHLRAVEGETNRTSVPPKRVIWWHSGSGAPRRRAGRAWLKPRCGCRGAGRWPGARAGGAQQRAESCARCADLTKSSRRRRSGERTRGLRGGGAESLRAATDGGPRPVSRRTATDLWRAAGGRQRKEAGWAQPHSRGSALASAAAPLQRVGQAETTRASPCRRAHLGRRRRAAGAAAGVAGPAPLPARKDESRARWARRAKRIRAKKGSTA